MDDLFQELQLKRKQLDQGILQLRKNGTAYAKAENDYKIKLRQEILALRDKGEAVGIINMICYGIPSVAELRLKRDIAKATYEANQEAIQSIKLQLRLIESQLAREWGNG